MTIVTGYQPLGSWLAPIHNLPVPDVDAMRRLTERFASARPSADLRRNRGLASS